MDFGQIKYNLELLQSFLRYKILNEAPKMANFDITSRCNLKCEICYFFKNLNEKRELTDEEWETEFKKYRKLGYNIIALTGGEPALRYNVVEMADRIFPSVQIISNGTIKIPKKIKRKIHISIDGNEETHNKIRGVNCFDKIIKNVQNDKRVVVTCTLSTSNYKQIEDVVNIAKEANVSGVTFSFYTAANQPKGKTDTLLLDGVKLDDAISKLKQIKKKYSDFVLLSSMMIETFRNKKHIKTCFLKNKWVLSFYPDLTQKKPCVLGENVNCKTCGCVVPVIMYCISKIDFETAEISKKLYSPPI